MRTVFRKVIWLVIFLAVVALLNFIAGWLPFSNFQYFVNFFNTNVDYIIIMFAIFLVADLFWMGDFPVNLPGPLGTATGGVLLTAFVVAIFREVNEMTHSTVFDWLILFAWPLIYTIFGVVFVLGYFQIFHKEFTEKEIQIIRVKEKVKERKGKGKKKTGWDDIWDEIKGLLKDYLKLIRRVVSRGK